MVSVHTYDRLFFYKSLSLKSLLIISCAAHGLEVQRTSNSSDMIIITIKHHDDQCLQVIAVSAAVVVAATTILSPST